MTGAAYARRLVSEGATVVLADRNLESVQATAASLLVPEKPARTPSMSPAARSSLRS
ncbi:hypothetical protein ACFORO_29555 [Amycolatopsis halotolerans]|uniref:Uncharacterized protein n=1 Tax=Amycolatopsis halotolerans TaxID=330083 RepID=A0ABV7QM01_9PSEU